MSQDTFKKVIRALVEAYPATVDYDCRRDESGEDVFDLVDSNDRTIATISEREMTRFWNTFE